MVIQYNSLSQYKWVIWMFSWNYCHSPPLEIWIFLNSLLKIPSLTIKSLKNIWAGVLFFVRGPKRAKTYKIELVPYFLRKNNQNFKLHSLNHTQKPVENLFSIWGPILAQGVPPKGVKNFKRKFFNLGILIYIGYCF